MFWYLLISLLFALLAYWLLWRWTHRRMLELAKLVPGPPAWPIIGNALYFLAKPGQEENIPIYPPSLSFDANVDIIGFIIERNSNHDIMDVIEKLTNVYGDYMRFWLGPDLNIVVKNPADIRLLLTSNKVNQKGSAYDLMKTYIGPGILTGGPEWRNHRKIAKPSYNKKAVQHFTAIFNREADSLVNVLCSKEQAFDVYEDVVRTTTLCVCQTLMGLSEEDSQNVYKMEEVVFMTQAFYRHIFDKMTLWWLQIPLVYWLVGGKRTEMRYLKTIDQFTSDILSKRREALKGGAGDEEIMGIVDRYIISGELSEQEIKWETMSLFTTSQEASAKIASGVLMFLAHLPDWQDRVYNEIIETLGPSDTVVTSEQLKQLKQLDMVYLETLRYFSIAAMIQRTVEEEVTINDGKITLPKGTSLVIPIHELHRTERYWENPHKVDPGRFLPENVKKRDPNAFVPFSLGSMDCLGRVYATALIKTLVVKVVRKMHLEGVGSLDSLKLDVAISVKCANGYHVKVKPRNTSRQTLSYRIHA